VYYKNHIVAYKPVAGQRSRNKQRDNGHTMQQLRKYATVLEPLLRSGQRAIIELLSEAVFSIDPLRGYITRPTELVQCN
jgi:hypothetical protein